MRGRNEADVKTLREVTYILIIVFNVELYHIYYAAMHNESPIKADVKARGISKKDGKPLSVTEKYCFQHLL